MGSAVIFAGSAVKTLKNQISLNGGNDIITSTTDPTSSAVSANIGSLLLNSSNGKLYRKNDSGSSTNWTEVGSGSQTGINYISNPNAATNTTGWSTYKETDSVTFQDTGDTVTLNSHGIAAGSIVAFTSITSTTGISTNTNYYVVNPTTNTFQLASSIGGSALALTTNGSGTMVRAVPKTGTGGTPNVTWTRSTTTPLRGAADFNYSKGAANYMGEGVATDFTIDNADIAKAITIKFDYENLSGTYTTGDLTVYIIADPSGTPVIIQPAGYQIVSASAGTKMSYIATFQTQASGTSYRMVVHTTTPSTSAYDFAFDNFSVGPNPTSLGVAMTDWISFTPTGSWTSGLTYSGWYKRIGDTAKIRIVGTITGAVSSGNLSLNLPSGLVIDTSKLNTASGSDGNILGFFRILRSGSNNYLGVVSYNTTTAIDIRIQLTVSGTNPVAVGNSTNVSPTTPATWASGDYFTAIFEVPISGWSSNVVMSSDTATNVVSFRAYPSSNQTGVNTNNSSLKITFNSITTDSTGSFSTSNNRYVVSVPGYYSFQACLSVNSTNVLTTNYAIDFYKNGSLLEPGTLLNASSGNYLRMNAKSSNVYLNAGDYIEVYFYGAGNNSVSTLSFDSGYSWFAGSRIAGPAQIAATDTVACTYTTSAGASVTTSAAVLKYGTIGFDTTSSYNISTGVYTVPVSGKYFIYAHYSTSASTVNTLYIQIVKNTSTALSNGFQNRLTATSSIYTISAAYIGSFVAGDTIQINIYASSSGQSVSNNGPDNALVIFREGN